MTDTEYLNALSIANGWNIPPLVQTPPEWLNDSVGQSATRFVREMNIWRWYQMFEAQGGPVDPADMVGLRQQLVRMGK